MFKQLTAFFLTALLLLTNGSMALAASFIDVSESHWASVQVNSLTDEKVITGYPDGTFRPDGLVTREEFSSMLVKALRQSGMEVEGLLPYTDLNPEMWSYQDINRINDLDLVVGYPDKTFKPKADITKTEAMIVLANTLQGSDLSEEEAGKVLAAFTDGTGVPGWATGAVSKSVKNDIYVKYPDPTVLSSENKATRAEIADLLYQLRQSLGLLTQYAEENPVCKKDSGVCKLSKEINAVEHLKYTSASTGINEVLVKRLYANIEEGNVIEAAFMSNFTTKKLAENDKVKLVLKQDLYTEEGTFLLPAGSVFKGTVSNYAKPKLFNRNAKAGFNLDTLILPCGKTYAISAGIATDSGLIESGYSKRNFKRDFIAAAVTTGLGAAIGAFSGLKNESGKGAIIGTISGGGAGLLVAAIFPGYHLSFNEGDKIYIKLNQNLELDR